MTELHELPTLRKFEDGASTGDGAQTKGASASSSPERAWAPRLDDRSRRTSEVDFGLSRTASRATWTPSTASQGLELPPVDGGRGAWAFVAAGTTLEAFIWGFSVRAGAREGTAEMDQLSFGTFQDHWSAPGGDFDSSSLVAISAIGTTCLSIQYTSMLYLAYVYRRFPYAVRSMTWAALALLVAALFLSSFATAVWQLIILQGVLYGIGAGATCPCLSAGHH